jgi:hypothetical protein
MNKKITAIGLSAGLLAGAGAGFILQNTGSVGASSLVAQAVTAETVPGTTDSTGTAGPATDTDRTTRLQAILQPLVDDGTLTQAQADKVITAFRAAGGGMGDHGDHGGHGGRMGGGGPGMAGTNVLDTVATTIGISTADLQAGITGGKTIAEIAVANGSTAQKVIDALVAEVTAHFDAEVKAGEHTQADADQRIADATTRITDMVNNTQTARIGGMGGHGPGDGPGASGAGA